MKRDTIKKHSDFAIGENDPVARNTLFLTRATPTRFPGDARYGLVVTKRTFRHAVDRNLVKRKLRDWIAANEELMLPDFDYVFIARQPTLGASRDDGRGAMRKALGYIRRTNVKKNS